MFEILLCSAIDGMASFQAQSFLEVCEQGFNKELCFGG